MAALPAVSWVSLVTQLVAQSFRHPRSAKLITVKDNDKVIVENVSAVTPDQVGNGQPA
jgi:hypothetical protein